MKPTTLILALALATFGPQPATQTAPLTGPWTGAINIQGISMSITVTFSSAADALTGTIDIPQQGAKGLALKNVSHNLSAVHFELPTGINAIFEGMLDGNGIKGTFTQGPAAGTFTLTRGAPVKTPIPRPPYRVGAVTVTNGDVSIAGTLTVPEGPGPFPAVVLVTGSGAQTRDEDIFGFKVFAVIADHLTRRGIVVYRYDDRGAGDSTGSIATSTADDFAGDALAAVAQLKTMPNIDGKRIGILGHSEGGTVAAIAASRSSDVAFVVMLAGPGLPGDVVMRRQAADSARSMGAGDTVVAAIVDAHRALMDAIKAGASTETLTALVQTLIGAQFDGVPATQRAQLGDRAAYVEKAYRAHVAQLSTPWMKFMATFDPATALRQVSVPVFAAFGERDTQVPPSINAQPVREALAKNPAAVLKILPEANHLFQKANTGLVSEYGALDKAFVPGLLDDLSAWMLTVTGR
ncbi:MAG: alpha/beta fold hydrolase [Acidobacteria bacterium]|nr:alpha/beta fold hydrolase [Acidobacteriota bacterium]